MTLSDAFKQLLEHSLSIAKEVNEKLTESFYKANDQLSFSGIDFPFIDTDEMEQLLMVLRQEGKLGEYFFEAKPVAVKDGAMGLLITYEPKAPDDFVKFSVKIDKSRPESWRRFIILKEMCQLYCDKTLGNHLHKGESVKNQIYHLISSYIALKKDPDLFELDPNDENYTEFLSFYLAINLALPQNFWKTLKTLCEPLYSGVPCSYSYQDIANAFIMPEFILRHFIGRLLPFYLESGAVKA